MQLNGRGVNVIVTKFNQARRDGRAQSCSTMFSREL
jgi:hypothetical protein